MKLQFVASCYRRPTIFAMISVDAEENENSIRQGPTTQTSPLAGHLQDSHSHWKHRNRDMFNAEMGEAKTEDQWCATAKHIGRLTQLIVHRESEPFGC